MLNLCIAAILITVLGRLGVISPFSSAVICYSLFGIPAAIVGYFATLFALTEIEQLEYTSNPEFLYVSDPESADNLRSLPIWCVLAIKAIAIVVGFIFANQLRSVPFIIPWFISLPVLGYCIVQSYYANYSHVDNEQELADTVKQALGVTLAIWVLMKLLKFVLPNFNPAIGLLFALSSSALISQEKQYRARHPSDPLSMAWHFISSVCISIVCPGIGLGVSSSAVNGNTSQTFLSISNCVVEGWVLGLAFFGQGSSKTMLGASLQTWMPVGSLDLLQWLPLLILIALAANILLMQINITPPNSYVMGLLMAATIGFQGVLMIGPWMFIFVGLGYVLNKMIPVPSLKPLVLLLVGV